MNLTRESFRQDINALRALAVTVVVGFHLRIPGFQAGFGGVDSFFVITGYLMAWKVFGDLFSERFSLISFWAARARRIYPALAAMVVITVCAGFVLMMPDQYLKHLLQSLSALTFLSNFAFSFDSGYFSPPAQTKMLLHTWSLSVEWQFYFLMPIVALIVWRRSRSLSHVSVAFLLATAVSFAWCIWKSHSDATAVPFFSLRARAWEPLAGCLLAVLEIRYRNNSRVLPAWLRSQAVAAIGWLTLIASIIAPLPEAGWPGIYTVLPVAGTLFVIVSNRSSFLFGLDPVQKLGEWSYSIYLWHWPIWVTVLDWTSLRGVEVGQIGKFAVACASIIAGALSYSFVEQPFRRRSGFWSATALFKLSTAVFVPLAGFTGLAFVFDGLPGRFPSYVQAAELARRTSTPRDDCFRNQNSIKSASGTYCRFGDETQKPSLILWGDSFANQYLVPLTASARDHHLQGLIATQGACMVHLQDGARSACDTFNQTTLKHILSSDDLHIVVIGSNWPQGDEAADAVDQLLAARKTVIFIMPLLDIGFDVPARWIEDQVRRGAPIPNWKVSASPALLRESARHAAMKNIIAKHQGNPRLIVLDPQSEVCSAGFCWLVKDGKPNFRDTAHISNVTAMQYLPLFDAALGKAIYAAAALASGGTRP